MAFDTTTRNRLARFVSEARRLLTKEFIEQLQSLFGISASGEIAPVERLGHLDAEGRELAATLRQRIAYLVSSHADTRDATEAAVARLTREQAFTILNRLVAIRMAETRGLIVQSVGKQYQSKGFKVFESVAGSAIGETFDRYRCYLFCLFDELAIDLGVLFDRKSPQAMLFPREPVLLALLTLLDATDLQPLWAEDETIGWIYQYYNDEAERKRMREESAAPRNSRELAVRNQFFTPRYVVEFLTDNTLGRIWYEMTQGQTSLKDSCRYLVRRPNEIFLKPGESAPGNAASSAAEAGRSPSQEELLNQPVHIPYRPLKDPREIRLLDPACGSMHFGLYAFDLFTVIYDEAWEMAQSTDVAVKSAETFAPFVAFAATFADKDAFLRDVPRLIIEHNLHGIDIDPRAAQIAGLSLWLRAQRDWHWAGVKSADRPRITRSNIVCAEPMPGEKELLREFVEQQFPAGEQPAFRFLLEKIVDRMLIAGEAGSLLRIEEEIRATIAEAKKIWEQEPHHEQKTLFADVAGKLNGAQKRLDLSGITNDEFWERAEERIYDALAAYAEQAEDSVGIKRRLFADDAAQGFALIDICRKRYDAVVMNPPFGEFATPAAAYAKNAYGDSAVDIYAAFVSRMRSMLSTAGQIGAIIPRSLLYYIDFFKFRDAEFFHKIELTLCAELGLGVLDGATVRTVVCVMNAYHPGSTRKLTLYKRLLAPNEWESGLMRWCRRLETGEIRQTREFESIPGKPLLFALSSRFVDVLARETKLDPIAGKFHTGVRTGASLIVNGLQTCDDFRFIRTVAEIAPRNLGAAWQLLLKAADYQPYEADITLVVDWEQSGSRIKAFIEGSGHSPSRYVSGEEHYPALGAWYPGVCERGNGAASIRSPAIPSRRGIAVIPKSDEVGGDFLAGVLNSIVGCGVVGMVMPDRYRNPSYVGLIPVPVRDRRVVEDVTATVATLRRKLRSFMADEVSGDFLMPVFLLRGSRLGLSVTTKEIREARQACIASVAELEHHIDRVLLDSLSVNASDLVVLEEFSNRPVVSEWALTESADDSGIVKALLQYVAGVVFGRWDIRYAIGERPAPEALDPSAPLPICPPGMLQGDDGLPLTPEAGRRQRDDGQYPLNIAWDGIVVDDPEHPLDIERCARATFAVVWGDRSDAIEQDSCSLLGVPTVRDWFRRPTGFFADHLKRYSKSRRQAPIYWPLSTKSGDYTLWIYYHRLNDQTLHKCLADFLDPKIAKVEKESASLSSKSASKSAALRDFLNELKDLRDEIERVIKLPWRPNLNDGVLITASPLWKLFRHSKWSKDLKACWEELEKGDYDWAHLAHTIWPARVEKKCESNRSIAIAHSLEHLCKVEPPKPKNPRRKRASS
jgi:hypothetical protein